MNPAALSKRQREVTHYEMLKVIQGWKHFWMNQHQHSEEDRKFYFEKSCGIDSNMMHHLADLVLAAFAEEPPSLCVGNDGAVDIKLSGLPAEQAVTLARDTYYGHTVFKSTPPSEKCEHEWNRDGETCVKCGDKDWM